MKFLSGGPSHEQSLIKRNFNWNLERAVSCSSEERPPYQLTREALELSANGGSTHPPFIILPTGLSLCVQRNLSNKCGISRESNAWLFCTIENTKPHTMNVVHDGMVRWNIDECTTAFLHSDWLYFLWHGIKRNIQRNRPYIQQNNTKCLVYGVSPETGLFLCVLFPNFCVFLV